MLTTALANLRAHKARLLLSSLTVVLGVGFVAGTLIFTDSIKASFFKSFARQAQNVDVVVTPPGGAQIAVDGPAHDAPSVGPAALDAVRNLPDVAAAEGRVLGPAPVLGRNGKVVRQSGGTGYGISFPTDAELGYFDMTAGRSPHGAGEAALDQVTADDQHFAVGDQVTVVDHGDVRRAFTVVGIFAYGSDKSYGGQSLVAFDTATALDVTGRPGFDAVVARAEAGVSQQRLAQEISALPALRGAGDEVEDGKHYADDLAAATVHYSAGFSNVLLVFAIISVLVSGLVIQNTFQILVAQRARELALLRCVGATRRQVFGGTLVEAAIFGLLASIAGFFAGVGLAVGIGRLLKAFGVPVPTDQLAVHPAAAAVSIGLGLLLTVGSALLPARAATRVAPIEALAAQQGESRVTRKAGKIRIAVGLLLIVAGVAVGAAGMGSSKAGNALTVLTLGAGVVFIGVLALGPVIVTPVMRVLGWLPGRLFGPTARLATANASRNPRRVAATTAALTIGISLVTMFTVVVSSVKASATGAIAEHYPFDYLLSAEPNRVVPQAEVDRLRALPELGIVAREYLGGEHRTVNGERTEVGGMDPAGFGTILKPTMEQGSMTDVVPGAVAMQQNQLAAHHAVLGETVSLVTGSGAVQKLKLVAVYTDSGIGMPEMVMTAQDYVADFTPQGPDVVAMSAKAGVSPARSRAAVEAAVGDDPLVTLGSVADYKKTLTSQLDSLLALFTGMLGLAILIALIGIANTLSLSVIERTRESALLRALGLTRGQLRRMLLAEAMLMAVLGVGLGVALGASFGWALVHVFIGLSGSGTLSFPFGQLLLYVAAGALAGVLAAVVPARRAARQTVAAAITAV